MESAKACLHSSEKIGSLLENIVEASNQANGGVPGNLQSSLRSAQSKQAVAVKLARSSCALLPSTSPDQHVSLVPSVEKMKAGATQLESSLEALHTLLKERIAGTQPKGGGGVLGFLKRDDSNNVAQRLESATQVFSESVDALDSAVAASPRPSLWTLGPSFYKPPPEFENVLSALDLESESHSRPCLFLYGAPATGKSALLGQLNELYVAGAKLRSQKALSDSYAGEGGAESLPHNALAARFPDGVAMCRFGSGPRPVAMRYLSAPPNASAVESFRFQRIMHLVTAVDGKLLARRRAAGAAWPSSVSSAKQLLRHVLAGRNMLILVDDLEKGDEVVFDFLLDVLRCSSGGSALVVTSRDGFAKGKVGVRVFQVGPGDMDIGEDDGLVELMLASYAYNDVESRPIAQQHQEIGFKLVDMCRCSPLAAKLVGGELARRGVSDVHNWRRVLDQFKSKSSLGQESASGSASVQQAYQLALASMDLDTTELVRLFNLFPPGDPVPVSALQAVWGCISSSRRGVMECVQLLVDAGILNQSDISADSDTGTVTFPPTFASFLSTLSNRDVAMRPPPVPRLRHPHMMWRMFHQQMDMETAMSMPECYALCALALYGTVEVAEAARAELNYIALPKDAISLSWWPLHHLFSVSVHGLLDAASFFFTDIMASAPSPVASVSTRASSFARTPMARASRAASASPFALPTSIPASAASIGAMSLPPAHVAADMATVFKADSDSGTESGMAPAVEMPPRGTRELLISAAVGRVWPALCSAVPKLLCHPMVTTATIVFMVGCGGSASFSNSVWGPQCSTSVQELATALDSSRLSAKLLRWVADVLLAVRGQQTTVLYLMREVMDMYDHLVGAGNESANSAMHTTLISEHLEVHWELASALRAAGHLDDALAQQRKLLEIQRKHGGELDAHTASALEGVGTVLHELGRYKDALDVKQQALEIRKAVQGPNHRKTAESYYLVGVTLLDLGRREEALAHEELALETRKFILGDIHAETANSHTYVGFVLHCMGRFKESLSHRKQALDIRKTVLGDGHVGISDSLRDVGSSYVALERYTDALKVMQDSLQLRHPEDGLDAEAGDAYYAMGLVLMKMKRLPDALSNCERALEIRKQVLGENHTKTMDACYTVGYLLHQLGKYPKALRYKRQLLELRKAINGENDLSTAASYHSVGLALDAVEQFAEALHHKQAGLQIRRSLHGENHVDVAESLRSVCYTLVKLRKVSEALQYSQRALKVARCALGEQHAFTKELANELTNVWMLHMATVKS